MNEQEVIAHANAIMGKVSAATSLQRIRERYVGVAERHAAMAGGSVSGPDLSVDRPTFGASWGLGVRHQPVRLSPPLTTELYR